MEEKKHVGKITVIEKLDELFEVSIALLLFLKAQL